MVKKRFEIKNKQNETIVGEWFCPSDKREKVIIVIHGYMTDRTYSTEEFSEPLRENNVHHISFDLSGCGESEGVHAEKTISDWASDSQIILQFAKEKGYKKYGILASSLGCSSALRLAIDNDIDMMCLLSPGIDYYRKQVKKFGEKYIKEWKERGYREITTEKGITWRSNYKFIKDAKENFQFQGKVKDVQSDTVFIYGTEDDDTILKTCQELTEEMPNAQLIVLEGAGHKLRINGERTEAKKIIKEWFEEW